METLAIDFRSLRMLFTGLLVGAPLAWTAHRSAGLHSHPSRPSAVRMGAGVEDMAQSYAGVFAQSPGIAKAWALPREDSETLMVQRTARDIEGENHNPTSMVLPICVLLLGFVRYCPSPGCDLPCRLQWPSQTACCSSKISDETEVNI